jgi:antitoxin (DNA-binding transcriptional repressor) of toxin-antitoxin stability system
VATGLTHLPHCNDRMSTISVQEIQRDPLAFLQRVEAGEAFVVVRGERPLAEIGPLATAAAGPVPADFDHPLSDDRLVGVQAMPRDKTRNCRSSIVRT